MRHFPLMESVKSSVKMTRTQYAQLVSQRFPPPESFHLPDPNSKDFAWHDIGMKIVSGSFFLYKSTWNKAQDLKKDVRL